MSKLENFDRREILIESAANEFFEKGFKKASLSKILKEAKISKGSFYYTFENKEDLIFEILVYFSDLKLALMKDVVDKSSGDFFDLLHELRKVGYNFAFSYPSSDLIFQTVLKHVDELDVERLQRHHDLHSDNFLNEAIIEEFNNKGFHSELSLEFVITFINATLANAFEYIRHVPRENVEEEFLKVINILRRGLQSERRKNE